MSEAENKYFLPSAFETLAWGEDRSWWFIRRNQIILWALKKYAVNFSNYLEIGCGTGFVTRGIQQTFPATKITGAEYFEEGLEFARERLPGVNLIHLDATKMKFESKFDLIGMFDVLEHIEEDELVLRNSHSALSKKGKLALTVPQHMWMWSPADEYACHVRRYERKDLISKLERAGFIIKFETSFVSLLLPLMALNRRRSLDKHYDPKAEFEIPRFLNWTLGSIMALEFLLLRLGLRFRSGGSMLVIAEKR